MSNKLLKLLLLIAIAVSALHGASQENVVFSKHLDAKYDEKVYRKVTVLFTEARLKLQKKYKKYLNFEYVDVDLSKKKDIIKYLKEKNARYYVHLTIKDKKKCKNNKCKVDYIIKIVDAKTKRNMTMKLKAYINKNEFTEISLALARSNTKKLVKFLKKR